MHFFLRLFTSHKIVKMKISELESKLTLLDTKMDEVKEGVKDEVITAINAAVKAEVNTAVKTAIKALPVSSDKKENSTSTTIQIDHLQVDKIVIEHLDYANNFGQLGIKELSGKLNIGSTFEGDSEKINQIIKDKINHEAKVNFRAKKEP